MAHTQHRITHAISVHHSDSARIRTEEEEGDFVHLSARRETGSAAAPTCLLMRKSPILDNRTRLVVTLP